MPKHKNSNATFLAIFKHCEILNLLLKSGNTVAINWLVIKLAGHSELTTKTVFCCHFFSFKPFVFKFRVPLAKKGFFMVASMILLSTSVFPQTLNIPGNQKWHFKECWSWAAKMSKCKISFLVIRYLHIIRWHALSALRKKKFQRTSRVSSKPNETILIFATIAEMMTFCITCKNHSGGKYPTKVSFKKRTIF